MKMILVLLAAGGVAALAATMAGDGRDGTAPALEVGAAAPPFSLPGSDGKTHDLADYRGRAVVLAWFPKAFTGG